MSRTSDVTRSGDLDSLPSWISDHLGEGSPFMTDEINQSPSSPMEGSPEESKASRRRGDHYFYSPRRGGFLRGRAFPASLRFPIHPTIRYSISLSEFRNLFSLNSNPKPDQGWLYFKARNKKVLLGGYPSNVKGWKSKFFFVSGDEWEIPEGTSRKGTPRVPRTWGISDKHCNNPPWLYGDEMKVFEEIFRSVEESGCFSVPVLLESKSFRRVFVSPGSRASRTAGDNLPSGEAPSSSSDVGESQNPHEQVRRESPSRDDSIECLGSFKIELRSLLPHIPDLTLLRWTGKKVLDPILDHYLNVPSSNPSSESCSDSSLPVELESDAMSKRVSFKKIGEKLGKMAGASSGTPAPAKGVVIGEKRAGESIMSSPSKKGKADDGSKGKGVESGSEGKKKATSLNKASAAPPAAPSRPGEGTSAHLGTVPGPSISILGSPSVAERLLRGVIPQADKEKVEKLTLDQTATKLFHVIGQKLAADFKQQLAESRAREQQALDELAKAKGDRDSLADHLGKSGALEDAASKYFGEGFDFCKVQLRRHHPDLAIDLEGTVVDQDLLAEQDEAAEKREREKI
ncbi:hypothetical protein Acr_25g0001640 [Actinidia rufa]|uniref:Uncharacterized protein n=1 Tax=Actinidia rufa TaxID=165716 RepID=A0A7J0GY49_9ERIC|nr:hypothetical protein Acr_25g0001640 [Actinidia rufa]